MFSMGETHQDVLDLPQLLNQISQNYRDPCAVSRPRSKVGKGGTRKKRKRSHTVKPSWITAFNVETHINPHNPISNSPSRQLLLCYGKRVADEKGTVRSYLMQILDKKKWSKESSRQKKMGKMTIIHRFFNSELQGFHQFSEVASQ